MIWNEAATARVSSVRPCGRIFPVDFGDVAGSEDRPPREVGDCDDTARFPLKPAPVGDKGAVLDDLALPSGSFVIRVS